MVLIIVSVITLIIIIIAYIAETHSGLFLTAAGILALCVCSLLLYASFCPETITFDDRIIEHPEMSVVNIQHTSEGYSVTYTKEDGTLKEIKHLNANNLKIGQSYSITEIQDGWIFGFGSLLPRYEVTVPEKDLEEIIKQTNQ